MPKIHKLCTNYDNKFFNQSLMCIFFPKEWNEITLKSITIVFSKYKWTIQCDIDFQLKLINDK